MVTYRSWGVFLPAANCAIQLETQRSEFKGSTLMAVATATQEAEPGSKHNVQLARKAYYDKAGKYNMAPLWEVLKDLVTPEPKTLCQPAVWKFNDVKKLMLEAGEIITAE